MLVGVYGPEFPVKAPYGPLLELDWPGDAPGLVELDEPLPLRDRQQEPVDEPPLPDELPVLLPLLEEPRELLPGPPLKNMVPEELSVVVMYA